jgi:hypothetical protein
LTCCTSSRSTSQHHRNEHELKRQRRAKIIS